MKIFLLDHQGGPRLAAKAILDSKVALSCQGVQDLVGMVAGAFRSRKLLGHRQQHDCCMHGSGTRSRLHRHQGRLPQREAEEARC